MDPRQTGCHTGSGLWEGRLAEPPAGPNDEQHKATTQQFAPVCQMLIGCSADHCIKQPHRSSFQQDDSVGVFSIWRLPLYTALCMGTTATHQHCSCVSPWQPLVQIHQENLRHLFRVLQDLVTPPISVLCTQCYQSCEPSVWGKAHVLQQRPVPRVRTEIVIPGSFDHCQVVIALLVGFVVLGEGLIQLAQAHMDPAKEHP
jgi:hypothetical protein